MELRHENGVTLVELIITVSVLALLASFALPGFTGIVQNNAMTASTNELVTSLILARSEALKRQQPVTICWTNSADAATPSCNKGDGWESGWIVFVDDDVDAAYDAGELVLHRQSGLPGHGIVVKVRSLSAPLDTSLTYAATGFPNFPTPLPDIRNMLFCDRRADNDVARVINVSPTGRPQVRRWRDLGVVGMSCED